jgi:hypothetical protein
MTSVWGFEVTTIVGIGVGIAACFASWEARIRERTIPNATAAARITTAITTVRTRFEPDFFGASLTATGAATGTAAFFLLVRKTFFFNFFFAI